MNSPTNTHYKTKRRPVTPSVKENIPEIYRPTNRWAELDEAEAEVARWQRIIDRVLLIVLFFGTFYLSLHLVLWATRGFSVRG